MAKFFVTPNTYYSDLFMKMNFCEAPSYKHILSTLNDKIYQLYVDCNKKVNEAYEKAQTLIHQNIKVFETQLTTKEMWSSIVECIPNFVKMAVSFAQQVPGLNELDHSDFTIIINNKLFDFYIIQNSSLFINGESYQIIYTKTRSIHYTRDLMNKMKSKAKNDILFEFAEELNRLNLTTKEKALLTILCFTFPSKFLVVT